MSSHLLSSRVELPSFLSLQLLFLVDFAYAPFVCFVCLIEFVVCLGISSVCVHCFRACTQVVLCLLYVCADRSKRERRAGVSLAPQRGSARDGAFVTMPALLCSLLFLSALVELAFALVCSFSRAAIAACSRQS